MTCATVVSGILMVVLDLSQVQHPVGDGDVSQTEHGSAFDETGKVFSDAAEWDSDE